MKINFKLNGKKIEKQVGNPLKTALDFIREECETTGVKEGCKEGECGACGILKDGEVVNSCLIPAAHLQGCEIQTVEGLATKGQLNTLQKAFLEEGGAQCGFCTPGVLVSAQNLLDQTGKSKLTEGKIREFMAGNLCRCTGYGTIVKSILKAGKRGESK